MGKERRTGHQNQLLAAQLVAFRLDQRLTVNSKSNARMRMETQVRRTAQWHPFIAPVREGVTQNTGKFAMTALPVEDLVLVKPKRQRVTIVSAGVILMEYRRSNI